MPPDSASSGPAEGSSPLGGNRAAVQAVTRLLSVAADLKGPDALRSRLVGEARELFAITRAVLLSVDQGRDEVHAVAASPVVELVGAAIAIDRFEALTHVVTRNAGPRVLVGDEAARLDTALESGAPARTLLAVPMCSTGMVLYVLVLADAEGREFGPEEIDLATVFATAACASLAQMRLAEDCARHSAHQAALARAAKTLNESLDLNRVLVRICHEAASMLDADTAVVFRGDGAEGVTVEATYGMAPEAIGYRMPPGFGLVGKVAERDEALTSNDYQGLSHQADPTLFGEVRSAIAVPMHWAGSLRGVLAVYYKRPHPVTAEDLSLLEAFGELAAAACRNASAHAGLAQAARTDGLTGCLNHAAMHDSLRREIERCERTGHRLSLVLVDMDDFKQVNEEHGHLMGDEVLRRVGEALRHAVRPYDLVARYGGDEFAILAVESDELGATELAGRALTEVARSLQELQEGRTAGGASAGIAEWSPGETPTGLIERADRALMYGKRERESGGVIPASALPGDYRPAPARAQGPAPGTTPPAGGWPARSEREQTERLGKRTRQLAVANEVGTRLSGMTKPPAILRSAVAEMERALGYPLSAVIRVRDDGYVECSAGRGQLFSRLAGSGWAQPSSAGLIGRCLRERRPVRSGEAAEITSGGGPAMASELVAPLWVGDELWGALAVQDPRADAFDEDDARLMQTVADQIGSALRSAMLYERLEGAYLGTAEALAAAVESKDSYTAGHSRTVVSRAQEVGARLGLGEQELETLRLASIFHDIGKVGVPEAILNKRGPLTPSERREIERHTVVGERILSTVDFLADVLPLVRHEHERWDGKGYPDGLRGEDIPLGSRIILACDAYSAMISDRPYRPAMSDSQAGAELLAGAGTQFDERVVAALLQALESSVHPAANSDR